jgi:hypothetical protein
MSARSDPVTVEADIVSTIARIGSIFSAPH